MSAKRAIKTVKHQVRLQGFDFGSGKISFALLSDLGEHLIRLSESSLLSYVEGNSMIKRGRQAEWLAKSLDFQLSGIKKGSTILEVEAPVLHEIIEPVQVSMFLIDYLDEVQRTSALGLGMIAFNEALSGKLDSPLLDKYLLKEMRDFGKFLAKGASIEFRTGNVGKSQLKLKEDSIEKIRSIEEKTPDSIKTKVTGTLDMLKQSNNQLELIVREKRVRAILSDKLKASQLTDFFGKELSVTGIAHYNPLGQITSFELTGFEQADRKANYFEQVPRPLFEITDLKRITESQQYQGYNSEKAKIASSHLDVDQSLDELLAALK